MSKKVTNLQKHKVHSPFVSFIIKVERSLFAQTSASSRFVQVLLSRRVIFIVIIVKEGGHGVRAGSSNERNLNFNGHGAQNEFNNGYNNNNGYNRHNSGYNRHNERYGTENDQNGEFPRHNLNLNALPIDPVTETAVR